MTKREQTAFIRDLIRNVQADLMKQIQLVPLEWDGHELRQYVADKFQDSSYTLKRDPRRYRAYRNTVMTIGGL